MVQKCWLLGNSTDPERPAPAERVWKVRIARLSQKAMIQNIPIDCLTTSGVLPTIEPGPKTRLCLKIACFWPTGGGQSRCVYVCVCKTRMRNATHQVVSRQVVRERQSSLSRRSVSSTTVNSATAPVRQSPKTTSCVFRNGRRFESNSINLWGSCRPPTSWMADYTNSSLTDWLT